MPSTKSPSKSADLKKLRDFLNDAFSDYIAARVLLLARLPKQGAVLSSTAIEKYFKAILAFRGNESRGHLKAAHWKAVKNFDPKLFASLDLSFIELNRKCYQLRYSDDIALGFNLVIASREFLCELDKSALAVQKSFVVEQNGVRQRTNFDLLLESKDERLWAENHVLLNLPKQEFIYQVPQFIYEIRYDTARGLIEAHYLSQGTPKSPGFLRPGIVPKDNTGMAYELAFGELQAPVN